jgi:Ring finger domain
MKVFKRIFRRHSCITRRPVEENKETTTAAVLSDAAKTVTFVDTYQRMDATDLQEDIIEFLIYNTRTSQTFATILDCTDSHSEIPILYRPASLSALSKFAFVRVYPFDRTNHKDSRTQCTICLDRLIDGVALVRLPCGHSYHITCIVPWLGKSCLCPECRYEVETQDPMYEIGRRQRMRDRETITCKCPTNMHQCFFPEKVLSSGALVCHSTANVTIPRARAA